MKNALLPALLLGFSFALCFQSTAAAQVESPLEVGALGAVPVPMEPIRPPAEIASALPHDAVIRILAHTNLSPAGEITLVFDTDDPQDADGPVKIPHVAVVRDAKVVCEFSPDAGGYLASFTQFRLFGKTNAALLALRSYGDGAGTDFYILRFDGKTCHTDTVAQTYAGRIEVLQSRPAEIRIWSAGVDDTCVWCAQRYHRDIFRWTDGKFRLVSRAITSQAYLPAEINQHPIVKGPVGRKGTT